MKKLIALILAACMLLSFAACGTSPTSKPAEGQPVSNPAGTIGGKPAEPVDDYPITGNIVYFKDTLDWGKDNAPIYVYYWNSTGVEMVRWPGYEMRSLGDHVYSYELPDGVEFIIFNRFGDSMSKAGQTRDIPYDGSIRMFQASSKQDEMQASYVTDWDGVEIGSNQIDDGSGYNQLIVNTTELVTLEKNDQFEVRITDYELETTNSDAKFRFTVNNHTDCTLSSVSFFFLAYNEEFHARIIDVGTSAEVGWEDDAYIQEFTTDPGLSLKPGETMEFKLDAAKKTIHGYQAIVSSYTTSDGNEVFNSTAYEWYKHAYTNKVVNNSAIFQRFSSLFDNSSVEGLSQDERGAITLDVVTLFDVGSSELSAVGKVSMKVVIDAYVKSVTAPDGTLLINRIIVEGHTDTDGSYEYNQKLSEARATAVMEYCIELHPELKDYMEIKGCAYDYPVLNADGSVNKEASRRVCFVAE